MEEDDEGRNILIGLLSGHVGWGEGALAIVSAARDCAPGVSLYSFYVKMAGG